MTQSLNPQTTQFSTSQSLVSQPMKAKIALGLGDNTDYEIVWNSALLEKLIRQYAIRQSELETNLDVATDINSERELVISILSFLNAGRGGERWVASSELVEALSLIHI